jgi:hypothetical protein
LKQSVTVLKHHIEVALLGPIIWGEFLPGVGEAQRNVPLR